MAASIGRPITATPAKAGPYAGAVIWPPTRGGHRADHHWTVAGPSHTRAAATSAATPVLRVGSMTGANSGEWLDGSRATRAMTSAAVRASAKSAGSAPPSTQYTHGASA